MPWKVWDERMAGCLAVFVIAFVAITIVLTLYDSGKLRLTKSGLRGVQIVLATIGILAAIGAVYCKNMSDKTIDAWEEALRNCECSTECVCYLGVNCHCHCHGHVYVYGN